jgi:hypothetical protein
LCILTFSPKPIEANAGDLIVKLRRSVTTTKVQLLPFVRSTFGEEHHRQAFPILGCARTRPACLGSRRGSDSLDGVDAHELMAFGDDLAQTALPS